MRSSLRLRVVGGVLALLVPLSGLAGWLLVESFGARLVRDLDVGLAEEADTLAALLQQPNAGAGLPALLGRIAAETDLGAGKRIVVRRGDAVVAEAPPGAARAPAAPPDSVRGIRYAAGSTADPLTIEISVPLSAAQRATQRLTTLLAVGIPAAWLLIALGLWIVVGRALRPLADTARRLEAIGPDQLSARLPVEHRSDEVGRMVIGVNRLLERLAVALAQTRRFAADAAHELRTPLSALRVGLEVALARDRSADEYREALGDALAASERLTQGAEDLLTLARLEAAPATAPREVVDVAELVQALAEAYAPSAAAGAIAIEVTAAAPLSVGGMPTDLYRLVANLLDNALRHSPRGGRIAVVAQTTAGQVRVVVSDAGAGIAADEAEAVFAPFHRGRGARGAGSGLGLTIARAIARAHGGDLIVSSPPSGGCAVILTLPACSPGDADPESAPGPP
ncbi:MAG: ATP-binding protein [Deltaproteobacteria bacterium]|nr:ATP-binding protein [Deltaproteobacteria bacterium]